MVMKMYSEIISKLIQSTPNVATIRVFDFLIHKNQFEGGVVISRKFIADELKLPGTSVLRAINWLLENKYLTETTSNGFSKFIINVENKQIDKVNSKEESKEIEKTQPKQEIIRKGGKTITRTMIPGF